MPDWNPAEIIGNNPGRLAFDLYDYLVTSETWAIHLNTDIGCKTFTFDRVTWSTLYRLQSKSELIHS